MSSLLYHPQSTLFLSDSVVMIRFSVYLMNCSCQAAGTMSVDDNSRCGYDMGFEAEPGFLYPLHDATW